jgi:hypothetical protein
VTTLLGLITVFAGYTAVYALNDLVDYRTDREKVRAGEYGDGEDFLDGQCWCAIRWPGGC